ncbi:MAG: uroporphyrinogen decarboxylase family protein [Planctomycetota bacterium]
MPSASDALTDRELNLRVFRGEPAPRVFFQPRMEPWYAWHVEGPGLPERFAGMSLLEVYDDLRLSMRYVHYYTGMPDPVEVHFEDEVETVVEQDGDERVKVTRTPHGDLVEKFHLTVDKTWRTVEFPVKGRQDLPALRWLLQRRTVTFNPEKFEKGSRFLGGRGEPQFWVPKSPYQALCQQWMKLNDFIYALADAPDEVEEIMGLIDRCYDALYEGIVEYDGVNIVNFGENIHEQLLSPAYFEKYLIPWYEKRSGQLREAGTFTHVHIDGFFKQLLPYLADLPFDGLEALTPEPQGDVTLEEMAEHIGDKVLLDGIPAVLFLPTYPEEKLTACVERIVELFHPRLVLGISDELPEGAGQESLERVRKISDWCRGEAL